MDSFFHTLQTAQDTYSNVLIGILQGVYQLLHTVTSSLVFCKSILILTDAALRFLSYIGANRWEFPKS